MKKLTLMALAGLMIGCSDRQSITAIYEEPPPPTYATYEANMKPLFDASCIVCHSGGSPSGNYNLSTYAGILGNGSDATPNAIAGNANSLIITMVSAMNHFAWNTPADQAKIDLLVQWVVQDSLRQN